jgi:hypothetical protein
MKHPLNVAIITALIFSISVFAYDGKKHKRNQYGFHNYENINVDMEDNTLIITSNEDDEIVMEITEDYDLYLNGKEINLNAHQQELVKRYYHQWADIIDMAVVVGKKGAKIGIQGAKLGVKAVANLFKLIRSDYDTEDYEAEIEAAAEKIEAKAEKLEIEAEVIEELAEELNEIQDELEAEIEAVAESKIFEE